MTFKKADDDVMSFDSTDEAIDFLTVRGCYPCLSRRGRDLRKKDAFRFHINGAGNYWAEGRTQLEAANKAIALWYEAGRPLDGYAVL